MRRLLLWTFAVLVVAGGGLAIGWRLWWGPDPAAILAGLEDPPSPVLSPEQALESFRIAPGFRVELVAAEPLVVDPVAMDWDDQGRLYVVEMRAYMRDLEGGGEHDPLSRVVVLTDDDGDGRMDRSHVFLDGLVLPRAVAVLPEGVLVGSPPDLWLCRPQGEDPVCGERIRLSHYALGRHDPEHLENALLPGIDGWIHNAKSERRFLLSKGDSGVSVRVGRAPMRGQWGLVQDDEGLLFHNHNSAFLYGDQIPSHYPMRHPATATAVDKPGVGLPLAGGEEVYGVRVKPGLNRAYIRGSLRSDGRQRAPTGVSGLALQRGDQYGEGYAGDVFVPEVAGGAVAHFAVRREGIALVAEHRTVPDPEWGQREFLASTDERFRPVDARVGPDGCIWVIDMYRGLVQHANYVSPHLRDYVTRNDLARPGETGRLWRIVREDREVVYRPPPLGETPALLAALDHPNGWVRDRAQRRLVFQGRPDARAALRDLGRFGALGRVHALWTLAAMDSLDAETWRSGLRDADARVRRAALRAGEARLRDGDPEAREPVLALLHDPDPAVRLQAVHSLGELPPRLRPLTELAEVARGGDALTRQAVASGLSGLEAEALDLELARESGTEEEQAWLAEVVIARFLAARAARDVGTIRELLDGVFEAPSEPRAIAILEAIRAAQARPGTERVELAAAHPLFERPADEAGGELARALASVRRHFTWPGDPRPGGARPLSEVEEVRRARGAALYRETCAACHGADGRGQPGLAPSLVGSPWVRDTDDWTVRIVLGGLTGPILVGGQEWSGTMPPHGADARFDDEAVAGLVTYLRRAWGHGEEPASPERVAAVRLASGAREMPWTAAELMELPVVHRFDRFTGVWVVPIVGIELEVVRQGTVLALGMKGGGKGLLADLGDGRFLGDGMMIEFIDPGDGAVSEAVLHRDGQTVTLAKQD